MGIIASWFKINKPPIIVNHLHLHVNNEQSGNPNNIQKLDPYASKSYTYVNNDRHTHHVGVGKDLLPPSIPQRQNENFKNQENLENIKPHGSTFEQSHEQKPLEMDLGDNATAEQLRKIMQQFERKIKEAEQFGKKMKDPLKFKEFQREALLNYVQKIKQMNFPEKTQTQNGISVKFIVGRIASGKSSFINSIFGTKLAVGLGETTLKTSLVYEGNGVQVYDTPGQCQGFNIRTLEIVQYIASSHEIYILYPDSLKPIEHMVRVITSIKPTKTYLLRTQCDRFNAQQRRSLEEEIQEDYTTLQKWGLSDLKIFATSSKTINGFENEKVKMMIKSKPHKL